MDLVVEITCKQKETRYSTNLWSLINYLSFTKDFIYALSYSNSPTWVTNICNKGTFSFKASWSKECRDMLWNLGLKEKNFFIIRTNKEITNNKKKNLKFETM